MRGRLRALPPAVAAATALVLAACGGTGDGDSAQGDAAAAVDGSSTRTVEHALGTAEVPARPQAVVALGGVHATALVALGLTPVAAGEEAAIWLDSAGDLVPDDVDPAAIDVVGGDYEPNLERVAAAGPDLVIGDEFHADLYPQLQQIAPTVLVEWGGNGAWRQRFLAIAAAVGREEQAQQVETDYEEFLAGLPAALDDVRVAFVRPTGDGGVWVDSTAAAFPGSVAADAGIDIVAPPEGVGEVDEVSGYVTLSGERLDVVADADLIVVPDWRVAGEEQDSLQVFEQNPLWAGLPAVRSGDVLQVPGPVYNGGTHYSAQLLLRALADTVS